MLICRKSLTNKGIIISLFNIKGVSFNILSLSTFILNFNGAVLSNKLINFITFLVVCPIKLVLNIKLGSSR